MELGAELYGFQATKPVPNSGFGLEDPSTEMGIRVFRNTGAGGPGFRHLSARDIGRKRSEYRWSVSMAISFRLIGGKIIFE